jgi:hypothetical protein
MDEETSSIIPTETSLSIPADVSKRKMDEEANSKGRHQQSKTTQNCQRLFGLICSGKAKED